MRLAMLAASRAGSTVFRQNVGTGWTGDSFRSPKGVFIENPRPLHAGLCKGSSDLIGWTPVTITEDMVGSTVAVFTALEIKGPSGKLTSEQAHFLAQVHRAGGIAEVVRDPDKVPEIIRRRPQSSQ